jgi:hypothetical protein
MSLDYKSFSVNGEGGTQGAPIDKRWWKLKGKERAGAIQAVLQAIAKQDVRRQTQYQTSARLYGNASLFNLSSLVNTKPASGKGERLTYNVVQSAIDTVTSKMAKNKPKPMFLTSGGDWKIQRKAKKLDKFTEGIFYENQTHKLSIRSFKDACILGDGIVHVFEDEDRVRHERVLASELFTDWLESAVCNPRQLHRAKNIDRDILIDLFPEKESVIRLAKAAKTDPVGASQTVSDQVTVVESWHLRSSKDSNDGVHVWTLDGEELGSEDYKRDKFPFAFFKWSDPVVGFWAQGAAEQIQNVQLEINKILWLIQRSIHLAGTFKIWLKTGSKVVKEHLNNEIGAIINSDDEPKYLVPPIVQPELYNQVRELKQAAFEQIGVSQLSASAKKPEGLDSGKALREYNDIESDRFMTVGQAYEQFHLDIADLSIDLAKEIYEKKKSYKVKVPSRNLLEEIDWKDVDMQRDEFFMKVFPVSSLPNDPAGRLQTIQEYMQAGLMKPRTGRRLLDFPDLEAVEDAQNAPEEYLKQIIEKIVEDGEMTPPEPYDDLDLAKELALEAYAQGKMSGVEEEKLEMLRTFIDQVNELVQKSMPPPMPGPGVPAAGPAQAVPQAPPQSDMLPNVPGAA